MKTKTERVDDLPLLINEFSKSDLIGLLDKHYPTHGNWKGLSLGAVTVGFLTYILSCSDHRVSHVETWASERLLTLGYCFGSDTVSCKDFTDDKLGYLLDRFSDTSQWDSFEHAHNQGLINVYNLNLAHEAIRLDAMITQSHRKVTEDFKFGHSKQHRSDLPQLKTMIATLDPLSMPLHSITVPGNTADDPLYLPVLKELTANLTLNQQLFVGDSKMGSLEVRSFLQEDEQCYLVPLSKKQCSSSQIASYLTKKPKELSILEAIGKDGKNIVKAKAFELSEVMEDKQKGFCWKERRIVVYSPSYGKTQEKSFEQRLEKAENALKLLLVPRQGRKKLKSVIEIETVVNQLLQQQKVARFIHVTIKEEITEQKIRKHKERPAQIRKTSHFSLEIRSNDEVIKQHLQGLGWRVYACNASWEQLSTIQVIECYRNEYKIEHKFDELLNKITALTPVYLGKPNRVKALIRLLLLALKYVSLIEHQVRAVLKSQNETLAQLYPGNPKRATDKPTITMILRAFNNIHLTIVAIENKIYVKIANLNPVQLKILEKLKIPKQSYLGMNDLFFSNTCFSET